MKLPDYSYEPYGSTTQSGAGDPNTQQYTGRENDGTGLYDYRNRYYSPALARFISEDPMGWASGQTNAYAYVSGNPVSRTDPFGLGPWDQNYGLSNFYRNWLHRQDGGSLIKELKDPRTGQVPKDTALEY